MSENQQTAAATAIQTSNVKRREHFTAGMIRWMLNEPNRTSWEKELPQKCLAMAEETNNLGNLPSESVNKGYATLKIVPAAVLYWLGLYTGILWVVPGAALGILGSYLISDSIYGVFKAGKDARFLRTFLHYLLRMENADGVISAEELASLRAIIEFLPAPLEEKKQWLMAIESPDGYQQLKPSLSISDNEKEQILSGCWGLALCDGSDDAEREMFTKFGQELNVSAGQLTRIQQKMEAQLAQHAFLVEETLAAAAAIFPEISSCREKAAELLALVSLKPFSQKEWLEHIDSMLTRNKQDQPVISEDKEVAAQVLLSGLLLARFLSGNEPTQSITVTSNFQSASQSAGLEQRLKPLAAGIDQAIALLN